MDVHSQHQNLLLNKQDFQLEVVDIIANDAPLLTKYQRTYTDFQKAEKELAEMMLTIERSRANQDFLQFQYDELSQAKLVEGEQE